MTCLGLDSYHMAWYGQMEEEEEREERSYRDVLENHRRVFDSSRMLCLPWMDPFLKEKPLAIIR